MSLAVVAATIISSSEPRGSSKSAPTNGSIASAMASSSVVVGLPLHELNTTGTYRALASSAPRALSSRSRGTTPARSNELLPTPLCAYSSVSLDARRFPVMSWRSASRPKKNSA